MESKFFERYWYRRMDNEDFITNSLKIKRVKTDFNDYSNSPIYRPKSFNYAGKPFYCYYFLFLKVIIASTDIGKQDTVNPDNNKNLREEGMNVGNDSILTSEETFIGPKELLCKMLGERFNFRDFTNSDKICERYLSKMNTIIENGALALYSQYRSGNKDFLNILESFINSNNRLILFDFQRSIIMARIADRFFDMYNTYKKPLFKIVRIKLRNLTNILNVDQKKYDRICIRDAKLLFQSHIIKILEKSIVDLKVELSECKSLKNLKGINEFLKNGNMNNFKYFVLLICLRNTLDKYLFLIDPTEHIVTEFYSSIFKFFQECLDVIIHTVCENESIIKEIPKVHYDDDYVVSRDQLNIYLLCTLKNTIFFSLFMITDLFLNSSIFLLLCKEAPHKTLKTLKMSNFKKDFETKRLLKRLDEIEKFTKTSYNERYKRFFSFSESEARYKFYEDNCLSLARLDYPNCLETWTIELKDQVSLRIDYNLFSIIRTYIISNFMFIYKYYVIQDEESNLKQYNESEIMKYTTFLGGKEGKRQMYNIYCNLYFQFVKIEMIESYLEEYIFFRNFLTGDIDTVQYLNFISNDPDFLSSLQSYFNFFFKVFIMKFGSENVYYDKIFYFLNSEIYSELKSLAFKSNKNISKEIDEKKCAEYTKPLYCLELDEIIFIFLNMTPNSLKFGFNLINPNTEPQIIVFHCLENVRLCLYLWETDKKSEFKSKRCQNERNFVLMFEKLKVFLPILNKYPKDKDNKSFDKSYDKIKWIKKYYDDLNYNPIYQTTTLEDLKHEFDKTVIEREKLKKRNKTNTELCRSESIIDKKLYDLAKKYYTLSKKLESISRYDDMLKFYNDSSIDSSHKIFIAEFLKIIQNSNNNLKQNEAGKSEELTALTCFNFFLQKIDEFVKIYSQFMQDKDDDENEKK